MSSQPSFYFLATCYTAIRANTATQAIYIHLALLEVFGVHFLEGLVGRKHLHVSDGL